MSEMVEIHKTHVFAPADGGGAAKLYGQCHPKSPLHVQVEEGGKVARLTCAHCQRFVAGLGLSGEVYSIFESTLHGSPSTARKVSVNGITVDTGDKNSAGDLADLASRTRSATTTMATKDIVAPDLEKH